MHSIDYGRIKNNKKTKRLLHKDLDANDKIFRILSIFCDILMMAKMYIEK
jgi:hypothetical protein